LTPLIEQIQDAELLERLRERLRDELPQLSLRHGLNSWLFQGAKPAETRGEEVGRRVLVLVGDLKEGQRGNFQEVEDLEHEPVSQLEITVENSPEMSRSHPEIASQIGPSHLAQGHQRIKQLQDSRHLGVFHGS